MFLFFIEKLIACFFRTKPSISRAHTHSHGEATGARGAGVRYYLVLGVRSRTGAAGYVGGFVGPRHLVLAWSRLGRGRRKASGHLARLLTLDARTTRVAALGALGAAQACAHPSRAIHQPRVRHRVRWRWRARSQPAGRER